MPDQPPRPTPPPSPPLNFDWRRLLWYLPFMLLVLWLWQDVFYQVTVHTIPYSEFKQCVAKGQVVECEIRSTEILGAIDPKRTMPQVHGKAAAENAASDGKTPLTSSKEKSSTTPVSVKQPTHEKATSSPPSKKSSTADSKSSATDSKPSASSDSKSAKFMFRTVRVEDPDLVKDLEAGHATFTGVRPGLLSQFFVSWLLPLGIMLALWVFFSRRLGAAGQTVMNIGKSRARLVGEKDTGVTFGDVAGCDEAKYELQEIVGFLKSPERYVKLGAKIPKGVLLIGPPGTGKTLLGKAVAGEAKVPFFSLSGSDFVEMFVGVGAARVRDLFQQAKQQAPCIIFIDELDAIGRERGVHVGAVNDEREQTLNQLLVEMDGFEPNAGVILLAATNRPEVLDRALLRPGRFDRQVIVDAPDLDGREAVLKVHAKEKPLADDVDLRKIAQATPGFSGADLANALNEAALLAARRGGKTIRQQDLEEAVEKVVAGPERKSRRLGAEERERVAYHETGHALVGTFSKSADPVQKISIVPRGRAALGYTLQLPTEQQFLMTQSELMDRLKGLLGGRAAEETVYGEVSTGAENDLERATALARQMICMYGMNDQVGLLHCAKPRALFVPGQDGTMQTDCSPHTAEVIDAQVKGLLDVAYREAKQVLADHRDQLELVARELLDRESMDGVAFRRLLETHPSNGK